MKEVELLQSIPSHENIVKYITHRIHNEDLEIFLEYVSGGNLYSLIRKCGGLSESLAKNYLGQILEGLAFLHAQGIWWRDLKAANCLLSADGKVKLSDFGCSKRKEKLQATFGEKTLLAETVIGSIPWMAPEVITQTGYTDKADIWSLGILSLELVLGKNPWGSGFDNAFVLMLQIATNTNGPEIPEKDAEGTPLSVNFKLFVKSCLQREPAERLSAKELLELPLFHAS
jgi:mitogen-activated protein kinase kinase kinase